MNRLCGDCSRPMVPKGAARPEGSARHGGRGVCDGCHSRRRYNGTLDELPTSNRRTPEETVTEWLDLRDIGYNFDQAADRLRMRPESLRRALLRAAEAGDPRVQRLHAERARDDETGRFLPVVAA